MLGEYEAHIRFPVPPRRMARSRSGAWYDRAGEGDLGSHGATEAP